MPLWVMCSPVSCDARTLLMERLSGLLAAYWMTPFHAMPIAYEDDEIGPLDGEGMCTDELSQMLAVGQGKLGVWLNFHVRAVRRYFNFILLEQRASMTLCLEIPREILAEDSETLGPSAWLVSFLSRLAHDLECECVLSTRDHDVSGVIASLDVPETLARVRTGRLLDSVTPVILVVRNDLIHANELTSLIESQPAAGFHLEDDGAYHVLWSLKGAV